MPQTMFQSVLKSIADAGRDLFEMRLGGAQGGSGIAALCRDLMSQKGEALGTALAREVLTAYQELDAAGKLAFFRMLQSDLGPDPEKIEQAIVRYGANKDEAALAALARATEAPRKTLIRRLNMAPGGTAAIVRMREDLLQLLSAHRNLTPTDADFQRQLASWFNRGFLTLERIDWRTPAHVLEKLIHYEAVHEFQGWSDLRRRLDDDRRCFAFFHPALPDEPLIFVQVALVNGLSSSIQVLLDDAERGDPADADTAIFYSITNCQEGLKGISFGSFLIKQVVTELQAELPNLKTFATLSPVPGFMSWLRSVCLDPPDWFGEDLQKPLLRLDTPGWHEDEAAAGALKSPLTGLCARYLLEEKRRGRPRDSVARFHLGNGARLERINWLGDISDKGLAQSAGLLVNYHYDMKRIAERHEAYVNDGEIAAARSVRALIT